MCKRGDIFYADLGDCLDTSEQRGIRPVLIVSNDMANTYSQVVTAVPLTSKLKKRELPTHVYIPAGTCRGLAKPSMALAEQVMSIDKSRLLNWRGHVNDAALMKRITKALKVQIGAT